MDLDFLLLAHGEPFTLCNHEVQIVCFGGRFLAPPTEWCIGYGSLGFPARARVGQFGASAKGLTLLMDRSIVLRLHSVSPFTPNHFWRRGYSGSAVILKEEAIKATFSSPTASPVPFHLGLIGTTYRPSDGVESHRYNPGPLSPGGDMWHPRGPPPITACPAGGSSSGSTISASRRGGVWHTTKA